MYIEFLTVLFILPSLVFGSVRLLGEITPPVPKEWLVERGFSGRLNDRECLTVRASQESERGIQIKIVPETKKLGVFHNGCIVLAGNNLASYHSNELATVFELSGLDSIYFAMKSDEYSNEALKEYIKSFIDNGHLSKGSPQIYKLTINVN